MSQIQRGFNSIEEMSAYLNDLKGTERNYSKGYARSFLEDKTLIALYDDEFSKAQEIIFPKNRYVKKLISALNGNVVDVPGQPYKITKVEGQKMNYSKSSKNKKYDDLDDVLFSFTKTDAEIFPETPKNENVHYLKLDEPVYELVLRNDGKTMDEIKEFSSENKPVEVGYSDSSVKFFVQKVSIDV